MKKFLMSLAAGFIVHALAGGANALAGPTWIMPTSPSPTPSPTVRMAAMQVRYMGIEPLNPIRDYLPLSDVTKVIPSSQIFIERDIPGAIKSQMDYLVFVDIGVRQVQGLPRQYVVQVRAEKKVSAGVYVKVMEVQAETPNPLYLLQRDLPEIVAAAIEERALNMRTIDGALPEGSFARFSSRGWGMAISQAKIGYAFNVLPRSNGDIGYLDLAISGVVVTFNPRQDPSYRMTIKAYDASVFRSAPGDWIDERNYFATVRFENRHFFLQTSLYESETNAAKTVERIFQENKFLPLTFGWKIVNEPNAYVALSTTVGFINQSLVAEVVPGGGTTGLQAASNFFEAISGMVALEAVWEPRWLRVSVNAYLNMNWDIRNQVFNAAREFGGSVELAFKGLTGLQGFMAIEPSIEYRLRGFDLTQQGLGVSIDHGLFIKVIARLW